MATQDELATGPNLSTAQRADAVQFSLASAHDQNAGGIVSFDGLTDPDNPLNWTRRKKWTMTILCGMTTVGTTWASSIFSTGANSVHHEFGIGLEVAELGLTLFMIGLGTGPVLFAPLSELYGRRIAILPAFFVSACFAFATATAKDAQTIFISRFFCGFCGSAPVAVTAGILSDIWIPKERGKAMTIYAMAVITGPLVAPVVGGAFVTAEGLGWRWTEYITGILISCILVADVLFLDESYAPILLSRKARLMRVRGSWAVHSKHEEWEFSIRELTSRYLLRPLMLISLEPICFLMCLYASFVFGMIYMTFPAFPIVFQGASFSQHVLRGWSPVVGSLPFLAVLIGATLGSALNLLNQRHFVKVLQQNKGRPVPEARLPPMMIGAPLFATGLFIFGWTSKTNVHWFPSIFGTVLVGFGYATIFQAALNYLVDTYQEFAASAVAANTFSRCMLAGAFPLTAHPLFASLHIDWALSLLGFVAVGLVPIPFLFYFFGKQIRARGKWSKASI
ncbi:hypothetical protein PV08_08596 [Exophiala spinifera]|uniref:Major facilitator superfamily (MFS) profile domain-containing protein n=1 Tax=Exophiala spinifera TaxID=91928 RepID=A0A0D2B3D1_9EURO|nr:uncharacterized protein PV08_08596 [Exophiala spinifera]KIW13408.1 hypothetical protein PV08_08596 [Exophiala spinifera]